MLPRAGQRLLRQPRGCAPCPGQLLRAGDVPAAVAALVRARREAVLPGHGQPGPVTFPCQFRTVGPGQLLSAGRADAGTVSAECRLHRALPPQAPKAAGRDSFHSQPQGAPGQVPQTWAESLGCRAACPLAECRGDAAAFLTPVFPQTVQPCWNKHLQSHGSGLQSRALSLGSVLTLRQQLPEPCSAPSRVPGPWIIHWYALRAGELRI